jgi:uncharacterized protein YbaR (Trm112 family)
MSRLIPLTREEHKQFAKDMRVAQELIEPWLERTWKGKGVKSKQARLVFQVLNILSSKLCNELDNDWYEIRDGIGEGHKSPYYGSGKCAYI